MQIQKEMLLFCSLLVISFGLLIAADLQIQAERTGKSCKTSSKCCNKITSPHPNVTPWNLLTGGMLHMASL